MEEKPDNMSASQNGEMPRDGDIKSSGPKRRSLKPFLVLLVLLVLLILVVLALVIVLAIVVNKESNNNVCLTKECVEVAARVSSSLDYSVEPCDNFFQFACGGWMKYRIVPEDKGTLNSFSGLKDEISIIIKILLEAPVTDADINVVKKAKDLYASCMNQELLDKRGDEHFKQLFKNDFGGWPMTLDTWDESTFDLVDMYVTAIYHYMRPLFNIWVGTDEKMSLRRILKIDQPDLGMPGTKYFLVSRDDAMLKAYEEFIYKMALAMGAPDAARAKKDVRNLVDFEIRLAEISVPDEERRNKTKNYNLMTLKDVQGNYSQGFDWIRFFRKIFDDPAIGISDVTEDEPIINFSAEYFSGLSGLLQETPKRTIANYMIWRTMQFYIPVLGEPYRTYNMNYKKALFGISKESPRFITCTSYTSLMMPLVVGKMYIQDYFDEEDKDIVFKMIDGLHEAFDELLDDLDWMDEATKKVAHEKNAYITRKVGYPKETLDDEYLEKTFENFTFGRDTYLENVVLINRQTVEKNVRDLRKPVDKTKWEVGPTVVNAYYNSRRNQILFPAGILKPPFFSKHFPMSLNYGAVGMLIGHEITHGFDDQGRQIDKDGNLKQWWSDSAIAKFKSKAQCMINQYSNYTLNIGLNINGINTQGENIADNGGIKQSFKAYKKWASLQDKEEPFLPGLNLTHDQLFFVGFAQIWCGLMKDEMAILKVRTSVHSPNEFRVIGTAHNSRDFAEAFNCPDTSYMNPKHKCSVW